MINELLTDDIRQIREMLPEFTENGLADELERRIAARKLSSSELGRRCGVSHAIVDKWRKSSAKPNGKERMKELGMALGMGEEELNAFLYRNGYPALGSKNPYDSAARLTLMRYAGQEDVVSRYRELIDHLGLSKLSLRAAESLGSAVMSLELRNAEENGQVSGWFRAHEKHFAADDKRVIPSKQLSAFILLYIGENTVNELAVTGELHTGLRNLLYSILGDKAVPVRHLREKLIAFGLYENMTEDEINVMLECARLRLLSETETRFDMALLMAVRLGHERYPLYEYQNLTRALARLKSGFIRDETLQTEYEQRLNLSRQMANYYMNSRRTSEEQKFEEQYTSYGDRGLGDYVRDVLLVLIGEGELTAAECEQILHYTERTEEGKSIWT